MRWTRQEIIEHTICQGNKTSTTYWPFSLFCLLSSDRLPLDFRFELIGIGNEAIKQRAKRRYAIWCGARSTVDMCVCLCATLQEEKAVRRLTVYRSLLYQNRRERFARLPPSSLSLSLSLSLACSLFLSPYINVSHFHCSRKRIRQCENRKRRHGQTSLFVLDPFGQCCFLSLSIKWIIPSWHPHPKWVRIWAIRSIRDPSRHRRPNQPHRQQRLNRSCQLRSSPSWRATSTWLGKRTPMAMCKVIWMSTTKRMMSP